MLVSSLEMQRRLIQTKVETTHKPSKVSAAKNFFSSVFVIDAISFHEARVLKEIRILRYLHTNSAVPLPVPKFQNKAIVYYTCKKKPSRDVVIKRSSENMQQIYRRTPPCRSVISKKLLLYD